MTFWIITDLGSIQDKSEHLKNHSDIVEFEGRDYKVLTTDENFSEVDREEILQYGWQIARIRKDAKTNTISILEIIDL